MADISEKDSTQSTNVFGGDTIAASGKYTGNASTYQVLATWTVTTGKCGILKEVAFTVDTTSDFQLDIDGVNIFTGFTPDADCSMSFPNTVIPAGATVNLRVKSDGSNTITVYGFISGGEI